MVLEQRTSFNDAREHAADMSGRKMQRTKRTLTRKRHDYICTEGRRGPREIVSYWHDRSTWAAIL